MFVTNQRLGRLEKRSVALINLIKQNPLLYGELDPSLKSKQERQRLWAEISATCGFEKTVQAQNRWRSLLEYLRQHAMNVDKKTPRRYAPKTDNPEDQFIQLADWCYYEHMKFMMPYIELQAIKTDILKVDQEMGITLNTQNKLEKDQDFILVKNEPDAESEGGMEIEQSELDGDSTASENEKPSTSNTQTEPQPIPVAEASNPATASATKNINNTDNDFAVSISGNSTDTTEKIPVELKVGNKLYKMKMSIEKFFAARKGQLVIKRLKKTTPADGNSQSSSADTLSTGTMTECPPLTPFAQLSAEEKNLKVFFDSMLRATQCLPEFHQRRIQGDLVKILRWQGGYVKHANT